MKTLSKKASKKKLVDRSRGQSVRRILLVGGGNIAHTHAAAIQALPGCEIAAVLDVKQAQAKKFADKFKINAHFSSAEAALSEGGFQSVHILTPPQSHKNAAYPFLEAGIHSFIEKPMAQDMQECQLLRKVAAASGAAVRVNQNFVFHPAHQRLKKSILANEVGPLREVHCQFAMPLRQLEARQFGHWMFDNALNLILEQAVHPLSQLDDLLGPLTVERAYAAPSDVGVASKWHVILSSQAKLVSLTIFLGAKFPQWQISALGDDGMMVADYLSNQVTRDRCGGYLDIIDQFRREQGLGFARIWQSARELIKFAGAQIQITGRCDSFYLSIKDSIEAFYRDIDGGGENLNAEQGERLVELCEVIVRKAGRSRVNPSAQSLPKKANTPPPEVVVLGGTGFIGRALVKQMIAHGKSVRVMARNITNLDPLYQNELVEVVRGSICDGVALSEILQDARVVINLAHGGGGQSYEEIYKALVGGACEVAGAVDKKSIKKLIFVSSIAALYLGKEHSVITQTSTVDQNRHNRGDYARAKAEAELKLLQLYREEGIPVSIFRPGIVVGEGASPFHSGVGLYNRERICLGWNKGQNPLPFVLVDDVATALRQATFEVEADDLNGKAFNIIGDVRLTAQQYTQLLARSLARPLVFRPQRLIGQQAVEVFKYIIKKIARRMVPAPSLHDLRSRGMPALFDTSVEKRVLGWYPEDRVEVFTQQAIEIHKN